MCSDVHKLINLDHFPIHIDGASRDALIEQLQNKLAEDGCVVLKQFLTPMAVRLVTKEAYSLAQYAHRSFNCTNPYFTTDDPALDSDDPRRRFFDRSNAFIPADNFTTDGPLRQTHDFSAF